MESLNKEEYEARDRLFYSAMINAWLNTKIERDKQLIALSVTAIGLLVTLLRTVGASSPLQVALSGFALLSFVITVISVIMILDRNAIHIEEMLSQAKTKDKGLTVLDRIAAISFIIGIFLMFTIGINSAVTSLSEKKIHMPQEYKANVPHQGIEDKRSWNKIGKLRPQPPKDPQPPATPNTSNSSESFESSASSQPNGSSSSS